MKKAVKATALLLILILSVSMAFSCTLVKIEPDGSEIEPAPEKSEKEYQILGKEGNIKFDFTATFSDGSQKIYKVETTKDNLGDALLEGNIISGDKGEFGIYVTTIGGEEANWEKDHAYWYFYKDGEPLMEGISSTPIANGDNFSAVYTK